MFSKVAVDVCLAVLFWELGIFFLISVLPVLPLARGPEMDLCFVLCSQKQTEACVPKILAAFFSSTALMTGQIKEFIFNKKLHIACVLTSQNCSNTRTIAGRVEINYVQVFP